MHLLIPGRHHLLTDFQFKYIYRIIKNGLKNEKDVNDKNININEPVTSVIFAVTSCNHSNTRRNPLPFHLRAIAIEDFISIIDAPSYIYGIDDIGQIANFADYTIKKIKHESEGYFDLNPQNTIVLCSTPVLENYEKIGFKILPSELIDKKNYKHSTELPWELVEKIAKADKDWNKDISITEKIHPASFRLFLKYNLDKKVKILFSDKIIGEDGDITETRDYNSYVRQMDEIVQIKFNESLPFIIQGRIGDIGCAVGSWIKLACENEKFRESDFYGIEVSRHLFNICEQRKENKEFKNPYIFFSQKNAVTGLVFEKNSMNTIHTSSLTHEIESYSGRADLINFIKNRFEELTPGGVWINRDVVGPDDKEKIIYLECNENDGINIDHDKNFNSKENLKKHLDGLSTYSRFLRFAEDFRKNENYNFKYETTKINGINLLKLSLKDACEFIYKKDYTDNWESEMHETFCFWDFNEWKVNCEKAGFKIKQESYSYTNQWIVKNRFTGKVKFYELQNDQLIELAFPVTHIILVCGKN